MSSIRIGVVCDPESYEGNRVFEEIKSQGYEGSLLDYKRIELKVDNLKAYALCKEEDLSSYNILLIRIGARVATYLNEILHPNTFVYESTLDKVMPNKFGQYIKLARAGIKAPKSYYITKFSHKGSREELLSKNIKEFNFPIVVKDISRNKGLGVFLCNSLEEIEQVLKDNHGREFVAQEFIGEKEDLRILVLGGKILGAIKRIASGSDFRTNVSQHGRTEVYELDDSLKELAVKSSKAVGIDFAGADSFHLGNYKLFLASFPTGISHAKRFL